MKEKWKNDKKIRRNCVLAGIALVILLGASVYTLFIQPNLSTETYVYKEETVVRGNLVLGIMESGSLSLGESSVMYELDLELEDEEEDEDDGEDEEENTQKHLEIEEVYAVSGQRITISDRKSGSGQCGRGGKKVGVRPYRSKNCFGKRTDGI